MILFVPVCKIWRFYGHLEELWFVKELFLVGCYIIWQKGFGNWEKHSWKMGYLCDFCGEQRSMVYCRSDAACLCLSCDRNVHSANALSKRHSRTLLCERCNSQPALVRCAEEKLSLCQNCDWTGHGASTSTSSHKRQTINCYSGCPSAAELSSIWSFVLDSPSAGESTCEQEMGLMSLTENGEKNARGPSENNMRQNVSSSVELNDVRGMDKSNVWFGSSLAPAVNDQPAGSSNASLPKVYICSVIISFYREMSMVWWILYSKSAIQ